MAHNINTYRGRQSAWHQLGTVTGKYDTTDDLLNDPGFQFVVFKSQLRDGLGRPVDAWGTFRWDIKDKVNGNVDAATFLGTVGKDYAVMQHDEGFKTIDALMRSADGAYYETAGVLGQGEKVWALADLKMQVKVGDDVTEQYLAFVTGHDGSAAHQYFTTGVRIVCQNTLNLALSMKSKSKLTIRHTKNAMSRLTDAREALESIRQDVNGIEQRLNFLAGRKVNREAMISVLDRLFPKQKSADGENRDTTRRTNILSDILRIYESNDGNAFPEQRGTAYNLLNAITNYADHERSSKDDQRAESAIFGSGDALKQKAYEIITDAATGMQTVHHVQYFAAPAVAVPTATPILDSILEMA